MKLQIEMTEGIDYPKTLIGKEALSILFAEKIMKLLGLRSTDKIKIILKKR